MNLKPKNSLIFIVIVFCSQFCFSQNVDFRLMFYNVENLFDTIDNPAKNDDEFLPQSQRNWNTYKYYKKLNNISRVIASVGEWQLPDIVGMCEVENDTCIRDLLNKTNLYRQQYKYVHFDSPDSRGIDVALLYNPRTFQVIHGEAIPVQIPEKPDYKTRDILHVQGIMLPLADTLHVFVCHFPSRRGGREQSEPNRMFVANLVRAKIDTIFSQNSHANIAICGDFNDYPNSKSITHGLKAQADTCSACLVSLDDPEAEGTYKFQGQWNFLDQAIVSSGLVENYTVQYRVHQLPALLSTSEKTGESTPFRTYLGHVYHGGFSDHLPISITFLKRE